MPHFKPNHTEHLQAGAQQLGLGLNPEAAARLLKFADMVLLWNESFGLTAVVDPEDFIVKHLLDSLSVLALLPPAAQILDVGSGAGFPGIPLALAAAVEKVVLVEASERKAAFLLQAAREFGKGRVTVLARPFARNLRLPAGFTPNFIVSRATLPLTELLTAAAALIAERGLVCAMKGPDFRRELNAVRPLLAGMGLAQLSPLGFTLPFSSARRVLLTFRKDLQA